MEFITALILSIFFGIFTINGFIKFYFGEGLSESHAVLWFISTVAFAYLMGVLIPS